MKEEILKFLRNKPSEPVQQFNQAFALYRRSENPSSSLIRQCNFGFSEKNLHALLYDLQKNYGITQSDILTRSHIKRIAISGLDEQKKLRDEFTFLEDKDCPNEFKILIADKLTAWNKFKKAHAQLVEKYYSGEITTETDISEAEELQELVKESVDNFQLNRDIYEELEYYQEKKKILGKHPLLADKLQEQQIKELSPVDLPVRMGLLKGYIRKANREIESLKSKDAKQKRTDKIEEWKKEISLLEKRIDEYK